MYTLGFPATVLEGTARATSRLTLGAWGISGTTPIEAGMCCYRSHVRVILAASLFPDFDFVCPLTNVSHSKTDLQLCHARAGSEAPCAS